MKKYYMLIIVLCFLFQTSNAVAVLALPLNVGDVYTYNKYNSVGSVWKETITGIDTVNISGLEYIQAEFWNTHRDAQYNTAIFRSTDTGVYAPSGTPFLQVAPIGTSWSFSDTWADTGLTGTQITKIISVESVTVPYGVFDNAYVHQVYFDFDDPSLDNSAYWYDYLVPGVGYVKQVDYTWTTGAPVITELATVSSIPAPATAFLFVAGIIGLIGIRKNGDVRSV